MLLDRVEAGVGAIEHVLLILRDATCVHRIGEGGHGGGKRRRIRIPQLGHHIEVTGRRAPGAEDRTFGDSMKLRR